ncbi:MAG: DUF3581 domain-containing protein [Gammaproteobacteria bacterium]|nr:DUF3581 domain-containing protein [Gammaproteobacteria bacterium]
MPLDLSDYFTETNEGISISQQQASAFAKGVAGDFNPIHDIDAKRFCVPGDLLFSILLHKFGVSKNTHVEFSAMLGSDTLIPLPDTLSEQTELADGEDKVYLTLTVSEPLEAGRDAVAELTEQYVMFSGSTFPDILVELMRDHDVMINPDRPLVIYKDMGIRLRSLSDDPVELSFTNAVMDVQGKKAQATLRFDITQKGQVIGEGEKNMLLGGLRGYDESAMQAIVEQYNEWKASYQNKNGA